VKFTEFPRVFEIINTMLPVFLLIRCLRGALGGNMNKSMARRAAN